MISTRITDLNVLVVDDEEWNVAYVYEVLSAYGFTRVQGLSDPRGVAEYVRTGAVDLLLLDLYMPEVSGFDVLKQIQETLSPQEYLPILIMTSDDDPDTRQRACDLGATDFVPKPFEEIVIASRVSNLLRARLLRLKLHGRISMDPNEEQIPSFSTEQLHGLLADIPAGVVVVDQEEHIRITNQVFCDLFSIPASPQALQGESWTDAIEGLSEDFRDHEGFQRRIAEILAGRQPVDHQEFDLDDGRKFELDYVPLQFLDRKRGHLWIFRDVSGRDEVVS